jgi:hypothetical protein
MDGGRRQDPGLLERRRPHRRLPGRVAAVAYLCTSSPQLQRLSRSRGGLLTTARGGTRDRRRPGFLPRIFFSPRTPGHDLRRPVQTAILSSPHPCVPFVDVADDSVNDLPCLSRPMETRQSRPFYSPSSQSEHCYQTRIQLASLGRRMQPSAVRPGLDCQQLTSTGLPVAHLAAYLTLRAQKSLHSTGLPAAHLYWIPSSWTPPAE